MADMRILLNDKAIERLMPPDKGRYIVRDTELKGSSLWSEPEKRPSWYRRISEN